MNTRPGVDFKGLVDISAIESTAKCCSLCYVTQIRFRRQGQPQELLVVFRSIIVKVVPCENTCTEAVALFTVVST